MKQLVFYEWKKLLTKKTTWVVFVVLFVINAVFVGISGSLGSTYVEGKFYETHKERNQIEREHGLALSGRTIDDALLGEMQEAYQKIDRSSQAYKWTDIYKNEVRKYDNLEMQFKLWGLNSNSLSEKVTEAFVDTTVGERIYLARDFIREQLYKEYFLTEKEIAYWEAKNEEIETPFVYQYVEAYDSIVGMQGLYMICMLVTFFAAITMAGVFADEHVKKTDQLILSTRLGRTDAYWAKLLAGSLMTFLVTFLFFVVAVTGKIYSYGWEGFGAVAQMILEYWYPYNLSVGAVCVIMSGILLLSCVLVAIFTMLLAELLRNSVGALAVVVGGVFAARLVSVPMEWRVLSQLWNYIPVNLLKANQGFVDLRTVNLFGIQLTAWQFAPILYVGLMVVLVVLGEKLYNRYQVSGR